MLKQRTLKNSIKFHGIGLHSGKRIDVKLIPAPEDTGIIFKRIDIDPIIEIPANYKNVQNTMLATSIVKEGIEIKTIEHFFSALSGLGINNLIVEINGSEMPILDGSAFPFVFIFKSAGVTNQARNQKKIKILKEVIVQEDDKWALLEPYNGFEVEFEIDYNSKVINETPQKLIYNSKTDCYEKHISRARTFGFSNQIEILKNQNFILGGSLNNAILVSQEKVINEEGLRFENEFVKHKLLDAIGDLYLINHAIEGKYKGYKSGHSLNNKLLRTLMSDSSNYSLV